MQLQVEENTHYSEFIKGLVLSVLFIHTFLVHFRHIARYDLGAY